jgi:hypothetical protein
MFDANSKIYKLIPAIQIVDGEFITGHVMEVLQGGVRVSEYFTAESKPALLEKIKLTNGFKTKASKIVEQLLGEDI